MKTLFFVTAFWIALKVHAAACCGGGAALPSLLAGDDKSQFSASFSQNQVTDDVAATGIWSRRLTPENYQTLKLSGAFLLSDRMQVGLAAPMTLSRATWGWGDASVSLGYEFLPELDYSVWKPKGYLFSTLTAPTGNSVYDGVLTTLSGRGFWTFSSGFYLSKIYRTIDIYITGEVHKSFDRKSQDNLIIPGWGKSLGFGSGYNWSKIRAGFDLAFFNEGPIDSAGSISSRSSEQNYANATLQAGYSLDENSTLSLAYMDQSWFGTPSNTALGNTWAVNYNKRWPR